MKKIIALICVLGMVLIFGSAAVCSAAPAPAITAESKTVAAGSEVTVDLTLSDNPGLTVMKLTVTYGEGLELLGIEDAGVLGQSTHGNSYAANPYILYWNNNVAKENFTVNGKIVTLKFKVKAGCAAGNQTIKIAAGTYDIMNTDMKPLSFAMNPGVITVTSATTPPKVADVILPASGVTVSAASGYLEGVTEKQTVEEIIEKLSDSAQVKVTKSDGTELAADDNVGTGCKIVLYSGGVAVDEITVVIKGDVSGKGNLGTIDYMRIKATLLGTYTLTGVYAEAARLVNAASADIGVTNYLRVKAHILGSYNLYATK